MLLGETRDNAKTHGAPGVSWWRDLRGKQRCEYGDNQEAAEARSDCVVTQLIEQHEH